MKTTSSTTSRLTIIDWLFAAGIGIASLALYIRTLAPGVLPGDSGEFQVLAHQLGIAHCPGYPIYLLLAKLVTFLPVGEIAYRVNMFSAIMASLAVVGVYLAARLLSLNHWASLFGALVLSVSYTLWSQAVLAEVYTAAAAFTVFILVCVLGWGKTGKSSLLFAAGVLGGLSIGVHTTVLLLAPGVLVYLWLHRKEHPGVWRPAISGVLVGMLLWVAVFIAFDLNYPPSNIFNSAYETARSDWGLSQDDIQKPWVRIWFVATGQQWRSALDFNWGDMLEQAGGYFLMLPREFSFVTILFILLGLGYLIWKRRDVAALLGISLVTHWLVSFNYRIWDIYVFYITGYVILVILAAIGLDLVGQVLRRFIPRWGSVLQAGISLLVIFFAVRSMLVPWMPAIQDGVLPFIGEEGYALWEDPSWMVEEASMTVEQMKADLVFFVDWGWLYVYYYAAHIEQGRTDLRFIEASPRSDVPGLPQSVIEFIEANIDFRPIYFSNKVGEVEQAGYKFHSRKIWNTIFYEVVRP